MSQSVAVIGGGPAGSAAARLLASWGHDVALLTRGGNPERALGESIPPSCVKLLDRTGLRAAVDAAGFVRSTGNTVRWGTADERVEMFGDGALGYQVDRAAFDEVLLRESAAAGVGVKEGATVIDVRGQADEGSLVSFEHGGKTHTTASRWVLDCTGRAGLIARRGWRLPQPSARTMAIVGIWERQDGWPMSDDTHTLVESYEQGWGWSVPVSDTRRYVTLMVDPELTELAGRRQLSATYHAELAKTRSLRNLLVGGGVRSVGRVFARDASAYTASRFGEDGTLVVGDAASFVDPLSSYGVKKALASGWLAAVVTHSCLTHPEITEAALTLYDSRERAMYEALRRRFGDLSRDAGAAHPTGFWETRMKAEEPDHADAATIDELDVASLRGDADVLGALRELKERESIRLYPAPSVRRVSRATVSGNRVVMQEHLVVPAFPDGVRYVRNIDLVRLSDLAVAHDQVPELFDAYNRAAPPAPLPDFLGALSVLIGKGILRFA